MAATGNPTVTVLALAGVRAKLDLLGVDETIVIGAVNIATTTQLVEVVEPIYIICVTVAARCPRCSYSLFVPRERPSDLQIQPLSKPLHFFFFFFCFVISFVQLRMPHNVLHLLSRTTAMFTQLHFHDAVHRPAWAV